MSVCKDCKAEIRWVVHPESKKYMPPLEHAGKVWLLNESTGMMFQREAWVFHVCRSATPESMRAHLNRKYELLTPEEKKRREDANKLYEKIRQEKITEREAASEKLYLGPININCRRCNRKKGKKCKNLNPSLKEEKDALTPHKERREDWKAHQAQREQEILDV